MSVFTIGHMISAGLGGVASGYVVHYVQAHQLVAKAKADVAAVDAKVAAAVAAVKAKL